MTLDTDGPEGSDEPETEEVSCEEVSDDAVVLGDRGTGVGDFDPTPADQACTELFGGPDTATLEGEISGEDVDAELTRANGCEIERFDSRGPAAPGVVRGLRAGPGDRHAGRLSLS